MITQKRLHETGRTVSESASVLCASYAAFASLLGIPCLAPQAKTKVLGRDRHRKISANPRARPCARRKPLLGSSAVGCLRWDALGRMPSVLTESH